MDVDWEAITTGSRPGGQHQPTDIRALLHNLSDAAARQVRPADLTSDPAVGSYHSGLLFTATKPKRQQAYRALR